MALPALSSININDDGGCTLRVSAPILLQIFKTVTNQMAGIKSDLALKCFLRSFSPNADQALTLIHVERDPRDQRRFGAMILSKCLTLTLTLTLREPILAGRWP